jgi:hypothetical protein
MGQGYEIAERPGRSRLIDSFVAMKFMMPLKKPALG